MISKDATLDVLRTLRTHLNQSQIDNVISDLLKINGSESFVISVATLHRAWEATKRAQARRHG